MVSKKLKLLFTLGLLVSAGAFAQSGSNGGNGYMKGGYSIYDSSVIPRKRMGQQNEFWNNNYAFPAKPRNMWEVGVSGGLMNVSGDVSSTLLTFPNFAVHVRKAFGYIFSLRLQYVNGQPEGLNWKASQNYAKNTPWAAAGYSAPVRTSAGPVVGGTDFVYYNYKTRIQDLGLQGIVTLNNIRFHKAKTGIVLYGGAGVGVTAFRTKVNAFNEANGTGNYAALFNSVYAAYPSNELYKHRKDIRKLLKDGMDDTYESEAENEISTLNVRPHQGKNTIKPSGTVLAGMAFKLGRRINLAIEDRWTFVKTDLLDGQRWQEQAWGDAVLTPDFDSYNYASIGLNFNLGGKAVEPLWWLNPLDYAYSELNTPKHMKLPKPVLNDTDGDGVLDELDREPNTPAGCPVDTHGVTKDTDGDGVPDCKDKQLITPTECQPVNADGVGKCPDPECCKNVVATPVPTCPNDYPSLSFGNGVKVLSNDAKTMLHTVANKMKANPTCNISITGYPNADKRAQALCNDRNAAIVKYLTETEGISADRISSNCEVQPEGTNKNTVDIKAN